MVEKNRKAPISQTMLFFIPIVFGVVLNIVPRALSLGIIPLYLLTDGISLTFLILYVLVSFLFLLLPKIFHKEYWIGSVCLGVSVSYVISVTGAFYADIAYLYFSIKNYGNFGLFCEKLIDYLVQEGWFYALLVTTMSCNMVAATYALYKKKIKINEKWIKIFSIGIILLSPLILVWPLEIIIIRLFTVKKAAIFFHLPLAIIFLQNFVYVILTASVVLILFFKRNAYQLGLMWIKNLVNYAGILSGISLFLKSALWLLPYLLLAQRTGESAYKLIRVNPSIIDDELIVILPIIFLILFLGIFKKILKKTMFDDTKESSKTTGNFGSASWASIHDLKKLNAYDSQNGIPIGADQDNKVIYLPLCNKLT
jgi:hypothetical protein